MPRNRLSASVIGCILAATPACADIHLELIEIADATFGIGLGISGDGRTVTGAFSSPQTAFSWSASTSTATPLPNLSSFSSPLGVKAAFEGSVIGVNDGNMGYRYENGGYQLLSTSIPLTFMNSSGSMLAGGSNTPQGWIWTASQGYQALPGFAVRGGNSSGDILAGGALSNQPAIRSANGIVTVLQRPAGSHTSGTALDVSSDGSIILGDLGARACVWRNLIPTLLPSVPGLPTAIMNPTAMSDDGNVVVGSYGGVGNPVGAWLWTPALGTVDMETYLVQNGVFLSGFTFFGCTDLSADGLSCTGYAAVGGTFLPYYLRFDSLPVPNPSASLAALMASLVACRRQRHETRTTP